MTPPDPRSSQPSWLTWAFLAGLAGYVLLLGMHFAPVAAGADSAGYMASARLLSEGHLTMPTRTLPEITPRHPFQIMPLGFEPRRFPERLDPTYPFGLPLHLAGAYLILGDQAGTGAVIIGAAVMVVLLTYRLAREFAVTPLLAAAGGAAVGLCPVLYFTSVLPLSDTVATAWCLGAYLLALRADRGWRWALAAGFACGMAVLVRPSCFFAFLPLPLLLRTGRSWIGVALGGVPAALWMLFYQWYLYGSATASGYGPIFNTFSCAWVKPSLVNYATWLPRLLPAALLAFALAPWLPWRTRWRELAALFLCALVLLGFYAFYDITQQAWWYLRFVMPGLPGLVVLGVVGLQQVTARAGHRAAALRLAAAMLVLASPLCVLWRWEREIHVFLLKPYQQLYVDVPAWLKAHAAPGSVVASLTLSSSVYYYTDFPVLRWDHVTAEDFASYAPAFARARRPVLAALLRDEVEPALQEHLPGPGRWEKVTQIDICSIYRWIPPPP